MRLTTRRTMAGISTYADVDTSPATWTRPVVTSVSTATRPRGSAAMIASRMLSEIWSQILSGCPSVTDSEVNRRNSVIGAPWTRRVMGDFSMPRTSDTAGTRASWRQGGGVVRGGLLGATKAHLVLVDLVERDGERLVLDGRVDERPHVVEQVALVQ